MKNKSFLIKRIFCMAFVLVFAVNCNVAVLADRQSTTVDNGGEIPYKSYTYWEDYNKGQKTPVYSKPSYQIDKVITVGEFAQGENCKLTDVATDRDGNVYILDSGNSKVYVLNSRYDLKSVISNTTISGTAVSFTGASGIYVDDDGLIYIADTENARVLVIDGTGNVQNQYILPESELIPTDFKFRPTKVAVDSNGYTYIASDGCYYGAILYSPDKKFLGFFGANSVQGTVTDTLKQLWKRFTSNDVKRAADKVTIPFTFTDLVVGTDDFVYTTTGKSGNQKIQYGQVRLFNPGGKDILDASAVNFGDPKYGKYGPSYMIQDLSCVDVDSDGYFYLLDTTYGRVYWYSGDCSLITVFGGNAGDGSQAGTFITPNAIAVNGKDVLVCDGQKSSVTVFGITQFGEQVRTAKLLSLKGNNVDAANIWKDVIGQDGNCQIAYRGLSKACFDEGDNISAMEYARLGVDRETYSKAFKLQRTAFLEKYFVLIFLMTVMVICAAVVIRLRLKKKGIVLIKNEKLRVALSAVSHPAESFRLVKEKQLGSPVVSAVLLCILYLVTVLDNTKGGFAFTLFDSENYNALYVLLSTVGLAVLWTVSNWLVCTLAGGIGRISEIFVITGYSTIPIIFCRLLRLVLTHILIPDEASFLGIFVACCTLYAVFMLIVGIMRIHDYSFLRFLGTSVFTIAGIFIIVFLLFLLFLLSQQLFGWIGTLYMEMKYR